eukprot:scaffold4613_cov129-Isochrysis_galbana.AAC.10
MSFVPSTSVGLTRFTVNISGRSAQAPVGARSSMNELPRMGRSKQLPLEYFAHVSDGTDLVLNWVRMVRTWVRKASG